MTVTDNPGADDHAAENAAASSPAAVSPTEVYDALLIGGGIMSATLGTLLQQLEPDWKIGVFERLSEVAQESSNAWNNAGTGHAALCELNYTPEGPDGTIDPAKASVEDLLQAPVLYLSGSQALPLVDQAQKLRDYVDRGGFIFAEACCGSAEHDRGFRALVAEIFPSEQGYELKPLPPDHPVYRARHDLSRSNIPLFGIDLGRLLGKASCGSVRITISCAKGTRMPRRSRAAATTTARLSRRSMSRSRCERSASASARASRTRSRSRSVARAAL